jgi:hypothetical protein
MVKPLLLLYLLLLPYHLGVSPQGVDIQNNSLPRHFFRCPGIPRQYWLMKDTINNGSMEVDKIYFFIKRQLKYIECEI